MKVPIYEGGVSLPAEGAGAMGNLTAAALEGQAVARAGQQLLKITGELNQNIRHSQQADALATAHNDTRQYLFDLEKKVKENPDPATWEANFASQAQSYFQDTHGNLGDPDVQAHFKNWWGTNYFSHLKTVEKESTSQKISILAANLDKAEETSVGLYNQARDDFERAKIKGEYFGRLDAGVRTLLVHPDKAEIKKQTFDAKVMEGRLMKDAVDDPLGTMNRLRDTQEAQRNYPGIDPKAVYTAHGHASAQLHKRQEANVLGVQQALEAKTLTFDELTERRDSLDPNRTISLAHYRMYDALLTAQTTPGKKDVDPEVYIRHLDAARAGKLNMEDLVWAVKAGKYGEPNQAAHYYKELTGVQEQRGAGAGEMAFMKDPYMKKVYTLALDEISQRLHPIDQSFFEKIQKQMQGGLPAPREPYPSKAALFSFIKACKEAEAKGELTDEWMMKKAQDIIRPFETQGYMQTRPGARPGAAAPAQPGPSYQPRGGPAPGGSGPLFNPTKGPKQTQQEPW